MLAPIVQPAVASVDPSLTVIGADAIAEPGRIIDQILGHIAEARLVVADLSFLNPCTTRSGGSMLHPRGG